MVYVSAHSHSSVEKAALLAGFGRANLLDKAVVQAAAGDHHAALELLGQLGEAVKRIQGLALLAGDPGGPGELPVHARNARAKLFSLLKPAASAT